jgi:hypothetical protein
MYCVFFLFICSLLFPLVNIVNRCPYTYIHVFYRLKAKHNIYREEITDKCVGIAISHNFFRSFLIFIIILVILLISFAWFFSQSKSIFSLLYYFSHKSMYIHIFTEKKKLINLTLVFCDEYLRFLAKNKDQ